MQHAMADVLLVDDDPAIRDSFQEVLEEEGFRVVTAVHGADALRQLQSLALPQLIILDLMMPVMDGWSFLQALRQHAALSVIPVVVLSARALSEHEATALKVALYLRKPVNMVSLLMIVESYCRPGPEDTLLQHEL